MVVVTGYSGFVGRCLLAELSGYQWLIAGT